MIDTGIIWRVSEGVLSFFCEKNFWASESICGPRTPSEVLIISKNHQNQLISKELFENISDTLSDGLTRQSGDPRNVFYHRGEELNTSRVVIFQFINLGRKFKRLCAHPIVLSFQKCFRIILFVSVVEGFPFAITTSNTRTVHSLKINYVLRARARLIDHKLYQGRDINILTQHSPNDVQQGVGSSSYFRKLFWNRPFLRIFHALSILEGIFLTRIDSENQSSFHKERKNFRHRLSNLVSAGGEPLREVSHNVTRAGEPKGVLSFTKR